MTCKKDWVLQVHRGLWGPLRQFLRGLLGLQEACQARPKGSHQAYRDTLAYREPQAFQAYWVPQAYWGSQA